MLFKKIGIALKDDINPEVSSSGYSPYKYSNDDCMKTYQQYEVLRVDVNIPFKILNGILTINNIDYDIGSKTLGDVYDIFKSYGTPYFLTGFQEFGKLPALILQNCSNIYSTILDGEVSPTVISFRERNKTISSLVSTDSDIVVYDHQKEKTIPFTRKGEKVFFEATRSTKIYITSIATSCYLLADFSPKRVQSNSSAGYLLNFKKEDI